MKIQPAEIYPYSSYFGKSERKNNTLRKSEENEPVESKKVIKTIGKIALAGVAAVAVAAGISFVHKIKTGRLILVNTLDEHGRVISRSFAKLLK